MHESNEVISPNELEEFEVEPEANVPQRPVCIVEQDTKHLRNKVI